MESATTSPQMTGAYPGNNGDQQFCVSWNCHQSNMHSAFPKLLSSEQFVDVTLACDGGSIKCHKVVLSACSDYLERLLLEIPCQHPIVFLRDMRMWELNSLVEFMYRGEVYVAQRRLARLMQAAEALQIRGLSTQGRDNTPTETPTAPPPPPPTQGPSNQERPTPPLEPIKSPEQQPSMPCEIKSEEIILENDMTTSDYLNSSIATITEKPAPAIASSSVNNMEQSTPQGGSSSNYMEHSEALQHLEKALSACEATMTETPGSVKMEPDEHFQQIDLKPYSISMVPSSTNCSPGSPFPAIEGYQRRQRRSEEELKQASDMVARGMTFQVASEKYKIPISTIRFYMVRKGILQRRKRGRGAGQHGGVNLQPPSPANTPPFHMMNYRLPESLNSTLP